ncbi:MAG TPA: hypothetical protein DCF33_21040 [Saprospirales bacterium]|nr:hypothetical protein [Saprospirales bacterium]
MLCLVLFGAPAALNAQSECPEIAFPKFDPEHEPRTLCQKYSPVGKFPNRFGTEQTHFASQIIWNLNNGNNVFSGDIDLIGELIIDQDFTLLNCKVRIWPNVRIRVNADVTFTLDGSKLFCCQDLWQGIDLDYRSTIVSRNITEIEDAMVAMESPCTATLSISNTIFNRNIVGVRLGADGLIGWDPCPSFPVFSQFTGNTFQCNAPINGTQNDISYVGVQVFNTGATVGAFTSVLNNFKNLQFGVRFESQWWGISSAVNRCRFDQVLNDGIYMLHGNLRVERCTFLNNGFRGVNILETQGLVAQHNYFSCDDGVSAQVSGENLYRHIQIGGFQLDADIDINHNQFLGNFADPAKYEFLRCLEVNGSATMGGGTTFIIDWNNFNITAANGSSTFSHGILLSGELPPSSSTTIEFNHFFVDQVTETTESTYLFGITLNNGNKNEVTLYSNFFKSNAWCEFSDVALDNGIYMIGSMGEANNLTGNIFEFNPNTGFSNSFINGISSTDFLNSIFCDNDLMECTMPMAFSGTSMGTQYFGNTHTGGGHGLHIQDGFIGEQGIEGGPHNANKWYDKWINVILGLGAFHTPHDQAPNSRFYVSTPQSQRDLQNGGYNFFSEYHPADIEPDQMDEWFKEDGTGYPGSSDCLDHLVASTETDKAIAGSTILLTGLGQSHGWTAKRYLYSKLRNNPSLIGDDPSFAPFLSNEAQTSVGRLFAVDQKILEGLNSANALSTQLVNIKANENSAMEQILLADSILNSSTNTTLLASALNTKKQALVTLRTQDSLFNTLNATYEAALMMKLQEALLLNDSITVSNDYEDYEKTVNDIVIRLALFQNGSLTNTQISALEAIAAECPRDGGHGIYRARGLLLGCNEDVWNDVYPGCYTSDSIPQEQILENTFAPRSAKQSFEGQPFAYPNPASEGVFIRTIPNQNGQMLLQDMRGYVWRSVSFTSSENTKFLSLEGVPAGVFTCIISAENGERHTIKIFVVNP